MDFLRKTFLVNSLAVFLAFSSFGCSVLADSLLKPGDRVVFVGDSITGQSINHPQGYLHQLKWALNEVKSNTAPTLIALGGSGQSVGSWQNVEKKSREAETFLDIRGVDVKTTLDTGADVLIIMLGMNDLLSPYISESTEDLDAWAERYRQLLNSIRARAKPRVSALATITLLTDDPVSPKNRVRNELNRRVAALAASEGCILINTGDEMLRLLQRGRVLFPDFHVTHDFCHPNALGHTAVAMAMMKGLGETEVTQKLADHYLESLTPKADKLPLLSYSVSADPAAQAYRITYWLTSAPGSSDAKPDIRLVVPENWQVKPSSISATTGVFTVNGHAEKLITTLSIVAKAGNVERTCEISIPAPWLVAAGIPNQAAWPGNVFSPTNSILPFETDLLNGKGFDRPIIYKGKTIPWVSHSAGVDHTGGADPASIDPYGIIFGQPFDALYAVRWIFSEKERQVDITLSSRIFAGTLGMTVWLNGEQLYARTLTAEPKKTATFTTSLHKGWNRLLVKCDHMSWQWQFSCSFSGNNGDKLDDLRYSVNSER